jgi:transcriptional regulator with XRE-family HTH domain
MPKTIGQQIKEARLVKGFNQVQLAVDSMVSLSTIGALEQEKTLNKKTDTSTYNIRLLQKTLNIKIEL